MKESELTTKIIKALRGRGGFWFKVHGNAIQMSGIPDIIGCYRGHFIAMEVKLPRRLIVSKRQRLILRRIRRAGGTSIVIQDSLAALEVLDRVDATLDSLGGHEVSEEESPQS